MNEYLENIGSLDGLFGTVGCWTLPDCFQSNPKLQCYEEGENTYSFVNHPCGLIVSTDESSYILNEINLFPNPIQEILTLTINGYTPIHAKIEFYTVLNHHMHTENVYYGHNSKIGRAHV